MTMREVDEGRHELILCKIEEREPDRGWMNSYRTPRLPGLSPDNKSFLFKLIHTLLPSRKRLQQPILCAGAEIGFQRHTTIYFSRANITEKQPSLY